MSGELPDAVREFVDLTTSLADRWRQHLDEVQSRVDVAGYGADQAVADLSATGYLAAESCALLAFGLVDAFSTVSAKRPLVATVESEPYDSPIPGATLTVTGPLVGYETTDQLPAVVVRCAPEELAAGETEFVVRADATGRGPDLFRGTVLAEDASASATINVEILVA